MLDAGEVAVAALWTCDRDGAIIGDRQAAQDVFIVEIDLRLPAHGAFGIQAALAGAQSVEGLDVSAAAVALAQAHAAQNRVTSICTYRQADAFDELRVLERSQERYGLVILDPPAFARSKKAVPHALAGYKDVNLRGLRLLQPGGVLVSCSCSQPVSDDDFWMMLQSAARDAHRQIRLLEQRGQGPDHPVLAGMPETRYLKCFIVQVF